MTDTLRKSTLLRSATLVPIAAMAFVVAGCGNNNNDGPVVVTPPPTGTPGPTPTPAPSGTFDVSRCLNQVIPGTGGTTVAGAVVPDTLTLNLAAASGFPNGRRLPDPVIDVTLAVIFLDLTKHSPLTFANVPVNPPANDVAFRSAFPYLAPPQGSPPLASSTGAGFTFRTQSPSAYVRVDRMGMPAVSTALIPSGRKIAYNDANPADDAAGTFVPDLTSELTTLTNALADDIVGLGLSPCATPR